MHSRGGRLVTPVDGYSTVLESSLALSTEVAKMTPADWALTFQMLYELNPASSADGTGGFCCCLAVAWPMPTGLCLCLLGRVTMWSAHHPSGPKSTLEKAVPPSAWSSWSLLWSAFESHPALQISGCHGISNPPPWDFIRSSGQILQLEISRDISHTSKTLSGV